MPPTMGGKHTDDLFGAPGYYRGFSTPSDRHIPAVDESCAGWRQARPQWTRTSRAHGADLARETSRAGADLLFGARFTDATISDDRVHLHGLDLSCRYLLGADGAKSRVAQSLGLGANKEFLTGLEVEYEETPTVDPDFLHCFVDSALAPGYLGWVVPGVGITQAGIAVSDGPFGNKRKPDLKSFLKRVDPNFALWNCEVKHKRSGPIPCGGLVHPLSTHRVLLTGDAAGLVSPLTAGGIRLAFQYGRRAGGAIASYLQDGGADPGAVMAKEYPRFGVKTWMRRAWSVAPPNAVLNATLFTPPMRALAQWIYFQKRGAKATTPLIPAKAEIQLIK